MRECKTLSEVLLGGEKLECVEDFDGGDLTDFRCEIENASRKYIRDVIFLLK